MSLPLSPTGILRNKYARHFGIKQTTLKHFDEMFIAQLERCKDDHARRVLLGIVTPRKKAKK